MGNTASTTPSPTQGLSALRQSISVCLACHKNDIDDYSTRRTLQTKELLTTFIRDTFNTDESTRIQWTTWDENGADIVVPHDAGWVQDDDLSFAPKHMVDRKNEFDVIASVFCPTLVLPTHHVAFAYRLLKPDGLFVVFGSGSPQEWNNNIGDKRNTAGQDPLDTNCATPPVLVSYHPSDDLRSKLTVFQKKANHRFSEIF